MWVCAIIYGNAIVKHFEKELSENGKNYDYCAIKFYRMDEMIKCNVFPNERSECL